MSKDFLDCPFCGKTPEIGECHHYLKNKKGHYMINEKGEKMFEIGYYIQCCFGYFHADENECGSPDSILTYPELKNLWNTRFFPIKNNTSNESELTENIVSVRFMMENFKK